MNSAQQILLSSLKAGPGSAYPPYALAMADNSRWSMPDGSTYEKQAVLYQRLSWISTAIDFVAEAAGARAFNVKKLEGEDTTDIPNHEFELMLKRPNPQQSRFEFIRDYFAWRKLTGNVYVYLNRPSEFAAPVELWIVPSHLIRPVPDGQSYIKGYVFKGGKTEIALQPWQIMHDKTFNPLSPFVGLSAIESLALDANADLSQQGYAAKLFGKDNAKIPGALAFADNINDGDWQKMQEETAQKWGGMNRSGPLWLRNVGKGGVEWVQMALSQKEMEFIQQRNFTKEEIWAKLAPGLASVLAINATEANALAGKAILAEYALWPMLTAAAEKITNDILPTYGENLTGEFDDPRKSDRIVELQEQTEYSKTHTIAEIRAEYYGDDPLGDDRDDLLPSEIRAAPLSPNQLVTGATDLAGANPAEAAVPPAPAPTPDNQGVAAEVQTELKAWENFAVRRLGKSSARDFEPRAIPLLQATRIKTALNRMKMNNINPSPADVNAIFALERGDDELKRANDLLERALAKL